MDPIETYVRAECADKLGPLAEILAPEIAAKVRHGLDRFMAERARLGFDEMSEEEWEAMRLKVLADPWAGPRLREFEAWLDRGDQIEEQG